MRSRDDNLPPKGQTGGTGTEGDVPQVPHEGGPYGDQAYGDQAYGGQPYGDQPYSEQPYPEQPYGEPLSLEDAEDRLRNFAALSDSGATYPGPDDDVLAARRRDARRDKRTRRRGYRDEYRPELHDEHYYGDYSHSRSSSWRWLLRVAVPVVFLGCIIAVVLVVLDSGILSGESGTSATPSASASSTAPVVKTIYKVKEGDTLSQIADKYNVSVEDILAANPKLDINNLSVGTKIKIPASD